MPFISAILDAQDSGILVVDRNCNILLMNAVARNHLENADLLNKCNRGFSEIFPSLCRYCPVCMEEPDGIQSAVYDMKDKEGSYYSVRYVNIEWIDKTPAIAIFFRNVNAERQMLAKLNSFASIDQLTGVPNRRKLMEDFEAISEKIAKSEIAGIMAIFDMDNFKTINDSYGHGTGDIMLKRLAAYFENDEAFRGHLYRLGGDEFVLLFAVPAEKFSSQDECRNYYSDVLKGALRSYSLPNIEVSCTLSMGASFFPWQGKTFSELLRKADIAMYKAKSNERNQIFYFEEKDDTAKQFKDFFICIQPVLTQDGNTYGYELVDRTQECDDKDGSLNLNEFNRAIDALNLDELESRAVYFISYSNQLLNRAVVKNLPKNKFVVKIQLTDQPVEADFKRYYELDSLGYLMAFSGINQSNVLPEIFRFADYCIFDSGETDDAFRQKTMAMHPSVRFIADGVNSQHEFDTTKKQGYALFQGYFFKRQDLVKKTKELNPLKVNYLRLLKLTSADNSVNFHEISEIISADVALSYKLLHLLNSAAVGMRNTVSSISLALTYLGESSLKKWIAILALRGLSEDKPMELIRLSLIRARFGEMLCHIIMPEQDHKHVFMVGMLSFLDVILEKSRNEVFQEIIVSDDIRDSLLTDNGPFSELVKFFSDYEHADWDEVSSFALKNQLTSDQIIDAYIEAIKWYNNLIELKS